jgi:hemerythrin-like domain-containing protein
LTDNARLLPAHIEKEESVLFPMAEDVLSEDEWHHGDEVTSRVITMASSSASPDASYITGQSLG